MNITGRRCWFFMLLSLWWEISAVMSDGQLSVQTAEKGNNLFKLKLNNEHHSCVIFVGIYCGEFYCM